MSVFDDESIERLRQVYNKEHAKEQSIPKGTTEKVWKNLQTRLRDKCHTGRAECIVANLLRKPKAPKEWALNRYEWLSSDDVDALEKNYMEIFPDYYYIATVPIDFDLKSETQTCLISALCSMKLRDAYEKKKYRVGIVINTDPHDGPGQHWVAVFCDIRPELEYPRVTYFDSYAEKPEKEIRTLMKRWKSQWDATGIHKNGMKMTFNKTRHQYKDSECGMYCLYFHYACLMNLPMRDKIPDDVINSFRTFLFQIPKIDSVSKE